MSDTTPNPQDAALTPDEAVARLRAAGFYDDPAKPVPPLDVPFLLELLMGCMQANTTRPLADYMGIVSFHTYRERVMGQRAALAALSASGNAPALE